MTAAPTQETTRDGPAADHDRRRERLRALSAATDAKLAALERDALAADDRFTESDRGAKLLLDSSRERVAASLALLARCPV